MKSHDAVEEDSRIEEELSLYASKVEAISFDTPVNEAKQSKVIEVLGAATFEQPSFKELPEVKSEDNSVVTESIGEEEVVPLPSFDASAEATSEAATDSIGEDDLPLPFGASDEAKLEVTDSIGEEEFPLPSFEAFGEANFEDADSFGEEDLSFDAFDEAKLDASDMEVGSLSLLDSDILLPLEAADLGAPMSSPGAQMLIGEIEEAVSQLSKEQIVVDTRRWMDFSCQVNTIESPTLNPVFSARCEDDSESESSSSSSEGEQNTLAENLLRTRRQNAQLKQLNEVVTKKNGVLVAQIEKQAAENFDLVCKYRACLQKLNEMLELEKKLGKRFEEEKLKMQHGYLEEQSNMAKQFELELERCKSDASVDSKSEMQEKFDSEITRLKDQHSLELENAVRDKSNELQEAFSRVKESALAEQKTQMSIDFEAMMRDNLDEQKSQLLLSFESEKAALEQSLSEKAAQMESLEGNLGEQKSQLQEEFSNEIQRMTQSFESEKAALEKSLSEKALEEMQTALANQEKDLKTQAETQMESLEGKFADQLEQSLNEQKMTLSGLKSLEENFISVKENEMLELENKLSKKFEEEKMEMQRTYLDEQNKHVKVELERCVRDARSKMREKFDAEISQLKDELEKAVEEKSVAEAVLQSGQEQVAVAEVTVKKLSAAVQRLSTENAHLCSQLTSADEIAEKLDKVATVRVERVERQKKYEEKLEEIRLNLIKPKKKTKKKTKKPFV